MSESSQLQKIDQIAGKKIPKYPERQMNRNNPYILKECNFCGKSHKAIKTKCPAWGKLCNHGKAETILKSSARKYIHWSLDTKSNSGASDDSYTNWLATVEVPKQTQATALMQVLNDCDVRFQLDTGADVNTLCKMFVRPAHMN
jgi:hypothetical protein